MKNPSESPDSGETLREKLIGLGERSLRKSYYPELQQRLSELERFKTFLDHSNDAIFLLELPSARIVDLNQACCRLLGWSPEELLERSLFEVAELEPGGQAQELLRISGEYKNGRAVVETVLRRQDGSGLPAEITLDRLSFQGTPHAIAVARDIEKRKLAEKALSRSEKQYHTLAEVSPIGIFYTDAEGHYRYVNQRWCLILGYDRDRALQGDGAWGNHPEDRERTVAEWQAAALRDRPFRSEYLFERPDGRSAWLVSQVMAEKGAQGEVVGYVGTVTDISERKRAEAELRSSEERRLKLLTQLELAAEVQARLLPQGTPQLERFELAARCRPAQQVAGDFYDWQPLATGCWSLTLGDVMGKGLPAAMLMATVRATLRASAQEHPPAAALQLAERALHQDLDGSESFVTLFHGRLDPAARTLTYVDCGHGHVFIRRASGAVDSLQVRGLPLGIRANSDFEEGQVHFAPGDALVLYSDGLLDALEELIIDNRFLADRLTGAASAEAMVERLFALVPGDTPLPDDLSVLTLRCRA